MIIHDLYIIRVTIAEAKAYAPWAIYGYRPLPLSLAFERMKADAFERRNLVKSRDHIQFGKASVRALNIEATHSRRSRLEQAPCRAIGPAANRQT
jgi:hypothetical protein